MWMASILVLMLVALVLVWVPLSYAWRLAWAHELCAQWGIPDGEPLHNGLWSSDVFGYQVQVELIVSPSLILATCSYALDAAVIAAGFVAVRLLRREVRRIITEAVANALPNPADDQPLHILVSQLVANQVGELAGLRGKILGDVEEQLAELRRSAGLTAGNGSAGTERRAHLRLLDT
jgi:hypothetical protein